MTTIQLSDEQYAQFTAAGLIVVDGERQAECGERCPSNTRVCERDAGHDGRHETALHGPLGGARAAILHWSPRSRSSDGYPVRDAPGVPNHALVAPELWRKLTEPCATCGGGGKWQECRPHEGWVDVPCTDPDCDRGRQVVTLTATCPHCVLGRWCREWIGDDGVLYAEGGVCGRGCVAGVVTLGRFIVRVRPTNDALHESYANWSGDPVHQPLDPLPQPGQFAVVFEPVAAPTDNGAPVRPVDPGAKAL